MWVATRTVILMRRLAGPIRECRFQECDSPVEFRDAGWSSKCGWPRGHDFCHGAVNKKGGYVVMWDDDRMWVEIAWL